MEEIIVYALLALGLGAVGGVIRTVRDTYKRYVTGPGKTLDDLLYAIDVGDIFFDLFFGVVVGGATWFTIASDEITKAAVFAIVAAGYAGADVIDGVFKPNKK